MIKFILGSAIWIALSPMVAAQELFACQGIEARGFSYENSNWKGANFIADRKFFIRLTPNGLIDKDSSYKILFNTNNRAAREDATRCIKTMVDPAGVLCTDDSGGTLAFNSKTGEGAISELIGAATSSVRRDTLSVQRFVCQSM